MNDLISNTGNNFVYKGVSSLSIICVMRIVIQFHDTAGNQLFIQ